MARDQGHHAASDGGSRLAAPAFVAAAAILGGVAIAWWLRRFQRFEVSGDSMAPTIRHGDWLLAEPSRGRIVRRGRIVLATDPRDPGRTIVKRVIDVDLHGNAWLEGDNAEASTDSRTFGPVAPALVRGVVRFRYWPRPSAWTS